MGNDESIARGMHPQIFLEGNNTENYQRINNMSRDRVQSLPSHLRLNSSSGKTTERRRCEVQNQTRYNNNNTKINANSPQKVIRAAFNGVWSVSYPQSIAPLPRTGHFTINIKESSEIFIGFGRDNQKKFLNDIWRFDIISKKWNKFIFFSNNSNNNNNQENIQETNNMWHSSVIVEGRKFASATVDKENRRIFIFGGKNENNEFLNELIIIDLTTKNVLLKQSFDPNLIIPRKSCIFQYYNSKLFIFGGRNATNYSFNELTIFDLISKSIRTVSFDHQSQQPQQNSSSMFDNNSNFYNDYNSPLNDQNNIQPKSFQPHNKYLYDDDENNAPSFNGNVSKDTNHFRSNARPGIQFRTTAATSNTDDEVGIDYTDDDQANNNMNWVLVGDIIYSYGGTKQAKMLTIDLSNETIEYTDCLGATPPSSATKSGFILVDNSDKTLIYFGGKNTESHWSLLYAFNIPKKWWYVFHVLPDEETVTFSDGKICDFGLFMLPRFTDFSFGYSEKVRQLVMTLGYPKSDPPKLTVIEIGGALSVLHLREDMLNIFYETQCIRNAEGEIITLQ